MKRNIITTLNGINEKRIKITFQLSLQRLLTINSSEIFLMPQGVNFMENLKIPKEGTCKRYSYKIFYLNKSRVSKNTLDKMNKLC